MTDYTCPIDPACTYTLDYPPGYQDPPVPATGDPAEDARLYATTIIPARQAAIAASLNGHLAFHGLTDSIKFEWVRSQESGQPASDPEGSASGPPPVPI